MSDELNLDGIGPEVFEPTPKDGLCLNTKYKEAYYPFAQLEMEMKDIFEYAEVFRHSPNVPVSSSIEIYVGSLADTLAKVGFSGKVLWEVHLPKPIQRGRSHRLDPHSNPYLQFIERSTAGDTDPDLFPQTTKDEFSIPMSEWEEAFYHFAIVKYRVNDYLWGSREIRPSPRECAFSAVPFIAEKLVKSLAMLGVAGHAQVEVYLPRPIRRRPRPIEVKAKRLILPTKRG